MYFLCRRHVEGVLSIKVYGRSRHHRWMVEGLRFINRQLKIFYQSKKSSSVEELKEEEKKEHLYI